MRFTKWAALAVTVFFCLFFSPSAQAIDVSPPPAGSGKIESPVIITGYAFQGPELYYVQLFNSSNEVIDVSNWSVQYTVPGIDGSVEIAQLRGLIKPGGYLVIGSKSKVPSADVLYELTVPSEVSAAVSAIRVVPTTHLEMTVAVKVDTSHLHWKRNISSSTGNYLSTFSAFTPAAGFSLYGNGFYDYPDSTALQIAEVLPNPRDCSPVDMVLDCRDYIKVYNPSSHAIDLSQFRLRIGYQGQTPSSSNTFSLAGTVEPGHYAVLTSSHDGRPITLTNSGSFVWLEDMYGVRRYDSTILEYPDASTDAKKGQAWAYDATDGVWKWTTQPTPFDGPSVFPIVVTKSKISAASSLAPCKQGQYRSEETNRCRSIANDVTTLAPCDDDEERNPATNRCRKLATLASKQLTPCKEGQERNPTTNRCRNIAAGSPPETAFGVRPVGESDKAFIGWWALGGLGVGALGYGVWEWRHEILRFIQKIGSFFVSSK